MSFSVVPYHHPQRLTHYPLERHTVNSTTDDRTVLDLFAGPGGWDQGVAPLGIRPRGVEWDTAACETGRAAGHERVQADVAELEPLAFGQVSGLIASPPCQGFSKAGKGRGLADSVLLLELLATVRTRADLEAILPVLRERMTDHRTALVLEPLRYALALTPSWLAWEQVPTVLPVWEGCAAVLRRLGYTVATGNLQAEQYGVPQTRKRALLVARAPWLSVQLGPAALPVPTHSRFHVRSPERLDPGVAPWATMAEALDWGMTGRPYPAVTAGTAAGGTDPQLVGGSGARRIISQEREAGRWARRAGDWVLVTSTMANATRRHLGQPAPTVAFGNDAASYTWVPRGLELADVRRAKSEGAAVRISVAEGGQLQTFPADYPWQGALGEQYRQVADAVPPLLAQHVVAAAAGLALPMVETITEAVA